MLVSAGQLVLDHNGQDINLMRASLVEAERQVAVVAENPQSGRESINLDHSIEPKTSDCPGFLPMLPSSAVDVVESQEFNVALSTTGACWRIAAIVAEHLKPNALVLLSNLFSESLWISPIPYFGQMTLAFSTWPAETSPAPATTPERKMVSIGWLGNVTFGAGSLFHVSIIAGALFAILYGGIGHL